MIIKEQTADVETGGVVETAGFKIAATAHAFRILSKDLYADAVQAVVRETSTNADDANILAGQTKPIRAHIPTMLEPWYSIRDYGLGLSQK